MSTKYYIDTNGNFIGGYEGEHGIDVSAYIEISNPPPVHASQTTQDGGLTWSEYIP